MNTQKIFIPLFWGMVIAGYPLFAGFANSIGAAVGVPTSVFSVALRGLVLVLALLIIFTSFTSLKFHRSKIFWGASLLLWTSFSVRFFLEINEPYMYETADQMILIFFGATLIPLLAATSERSQATGDLVFNAIFYTLFASALVNIYQVIGLNSIGLIGQFGGRVGFENLNPITLSAIGSQLCVLSVYRLFQPDNQKTRPHKPTLLTFDRSLTFAGIGLGALFVVLGGSRGPALALILSLALLSIFSGGVKQTVKFGFITIILLFAGYYMSSFLSESLDLSIFSRFTRMFESDVASDASTSIRLDLMQTAWAQFVSSPIFGDSIVVRGSNTYPHNLFLEVLMSTGIIGGLALLVLICFSFYACFRIVLYSPRFLWVVLLYSQNFIFTSVSGSVWGSSAAWCLMAFVISVGTFKPAKTFVRPRHRRVATVSPPRTIAHQLEEAMLVALPTPIATQLDESIVSANQISVATHYENSIATVEPIAIQLEPKFVFEQPQHIDIGFAEPFEIDQPQHIDIGYAGPFEIDQPPHIDLTIEESMVIDKPQQIDILLKA